jgi:formate-dependent nitrite reductase membrane component NrfD
MKKMFRFDLAWVIVFLVVSTLITLIFMEEEGARNLFAGIVLVACALLLIGAILLRGFIDRIG